MDSLAARQIDTVTIDREKVKVKVIAVPTKKTYVHPTKPRKL